MVARIFTIGLICLTYFSPNEIRCSKDIYRLTHLAWSQNQNHNNPWLVMIAVTRALVKLPPHFSTRHQPQPVLSAGLLRANLSEGCWQVGWGLEQIGRWRSIIPIQSWWGQGIPKCGKNGEGWEGRLTLSGDALGIFCDIQWYDIHIIVSRCWIFWLTFFLFVSGFTNF